MPSTILSLPQDASDVFSKGNSHAVENGLMFAYGLENVTTAMVQKSCDKATESYARQILNWPQGQLDKPDIFTPVGDGAFQTLDDCTKHFVRHLRALLESSPPKAIPTYPHGYVAFSEKDMSTSATLVVAYRSVAIRPSTNSAGDRACSDSGKLKNGRRL